MNPATLPIKGIAVIKLDSVIVDNLSNHQGLFPTVSIFFCSDSTFRFNPLIAFSDDL